MLIEIDTNEVVISTFCMAVVGGVEQDEAVVESRIAVTFWRSAKRAKTCRFDVRCSVAHFILGFLWHDPVTHMRDNNSFFFCDDVTREIKAGADDIKMGRRRGGTINRHHARKRITTQSLEEISIHVGR